MDMQVAENLGLKPVGQGRKASGFTIFEAQSLDTGMKWTVWCANKKSQGKLSKWYEAVSALSVEGASHLKCVDTPSGLWVAGAQEFGLPIAQYRPPDERRIGEVICLTYRFLDALHQLKDSGIPLRAEMFHEPCVLERGGLAPTLGFPGLCPVGNEGADEVVIAKLVGRFLYVLITGNAPPTEDGDVLSDTEGERVGAFDSLLLDWVEEHTLDTGLGGLAMQAYEAEIDAEAFVRMIYPHFEREVRQLVSRAGQAAQDQEQLHQDAETSRLRIETLEERIAREEHWLKEHSVEIEQAEHAVTLARDRLRQLEAIEQGIADQLGLESNTNFDLTHSEQPEATLPLEVQDVALPLAHNNDDIELDLDQLWPDDPQTRSRGAVVESLGRRPSTVENTERESSVEIRPSIQTLWVFVFGLVLGGLVVVFTLWSLRLPGTQSLEGVDRTSIVQSVSKGEVSPPTASAQASVIVDIDAASVEPPVPVAVVFDEKADASVSNVMAPIDMEVDQIQAAVSKPAVALPSGMVRFDGGQVSTVLSVAQAERLVRECARVFGTTSSRCTRILDEADAQPSVRPVKAFGMDVVEVEFSAYQECVNAGVCREPAHQWNKKNYPVTGVSAAAAGRYCRWQSKRLPTNAEWMMAVRAGTGRIYPWGDVAPGSKRANLGAWNGEPSTESGDGYRYVGPVGSYEAGRSRQGLSNLVGNVKEIVRTDEGNAYYVKGGGYLSLGYEGRVTSRSTVKQSTTATDIGFRCVMDL
jgi:formylglycine-generating enzyme required for sulfatase activity